MLAISGAFGASAAIVGSLISYTAPKMPTGPWMVVASSALLFISLIVAPKYGAYSRWRRHVRQSNRIEEDHVIKALWLLREQSPVQIGFTIAELSERQYMKSDRLPAVIKRLVRKGWIKPQENETGKWRLAKLGRDEARRLVRVHRLWETYLTDLLAIADDHVHDDADSMEHLITPEIEAQLVAKLGHPVVDPHASTIPYGSEVNS